MIIKILGFKLKISEVFFLLSGLMILASLPWISGSGFNLWLFAKVAYFTGIVFFITDVISKNKHGV